MNTRFALLESAVPWDLGVTHRDLKKSIPTFVREGGAVSILSAPVIYSLIVPIGLLDLWVTVYQVICFPLFGIRKVTRHPYIISDRHKLEYLNGIEKLHCMYCSYANGVLAYVREIAARTETYWCPIKHATRVRGAHRHYQQFTEYGDASSYRRRLPALRSQLAGKRRDHHRRRRD